MGLERVGHDWATELNWTESIPELYGHGKAGRDSIFTETPSLHPVQCPHPFILDGAITPEEGEKENVYFQDMFNN